MSAKFRDSSSKCSAAHPKTALWRNISASHSQNLTGMFLHNSVNGVVIAPCAEIFPVARKVAVAAAAKSFWRVVWSSDLLDHILIRFDTPKDRQTTAADRWRHYRRRHHRQKKRIWTNKRHPYRTSTHKEVQKYLNLRTNSSGQRYRCHVEDRKSALCICVFELHRCPHFFFKKCGQIV